MIQPNLWKKVSFMMANELKIYINKITFKNRGFTLVCGVYIQTDFY